MTASLVSPKYPIVIPKEVRRKFNVTPGQRLSLIAKDGYPELRPILKPEQLIGILAEPLVPLLGRSSDSCRLYHSASTGHSG